MNRPASNDDCDEDVGEASGGEVPGVAGKALVGQPAPFLQARLGVGSEYQNALKMRRAGPWGLKTWWKN